jgi:stage II sporulation protein D
MKSALTRFIILILVIFPVVCRGQVKIRLLADKKPEYAFFTVAEGKYEIDPFTGDKLILGKGETVMISKYNGRLAFKIRNKPGFAVDSVSFTGLSGDDAFSMKLNDITALKQVYPGDLKCIPDMGTIMFLNSIDVEKYVAGVVRAEGGTGKNIEYFKTQAVIVRTYMYKYNGRHLQDGYNLCDNTHCQVYSGACNDQVINAAAAETKGQVILDKDSVLIISAFHSNCGGQTSSSEDVWLTSVPYLKKVDDPYCAGSRNSTWQKSISANDWVKTLTNAGFKGNPDDLAAFRFAQATRAADYKIQSFSIPLKSLRESLDLRSTFFSVIPGQDSLILSGKGYGHGVGLCQEGAMAMASKGFTYNQIINFYYSGVKIVDISLAKIIP